MFSGLISLPDKIDSVVRTNSENPEELWDVIDKLYKDGFKLEIFARKNTGRARTIHIGNEIEGPDELKISTKR